MNQNSKEKRAAYQAKQEQQGKKVVNWIFGVLIVLAIIFMVYTVYIVS
ncbi:MAG: hypothetical protein IJV27_06205 [Prevotella sp.]|nr:hypothetical protein [Prevotella sp.]